MGTQVEKAQLFASLHVKGDPIVLVNIWDAGSAKIIEGLGAKALATGSWSVAAAHGYEDGEQIPRDLALGNVKRIVESVDIPVSIDFEGAYGREPSVVGENVGKVIEVGAVGINFEDQIIGGEGLYSIGEQSSRIGAARQAAEKSGIPLFINARTDIFLKAKSETHNEDMLEEAVHRARAYRNVGASGFLIPGLRNVDFIRRLCAESPLPINVMMLPNMPSPKELAELGVSRVSFGGGPYRVAMQALKNFGQEALSG